MLRTILFLSTLILSGCDRNRAAHNQIVRNLNEEIINRRQLLAGLTRYSDSIRIRVNEIGHQHNRFLLLSRDVENLNACVVLSSDFYNAGGYSCIQPLNSSMSCDQLETVLLQNELVILNQLLFENGINDLQMSGVAD